ncbi:UNC93-like protein isoform X2 [Cimex lectularius]|nr:UNC93-like protein isoform X2 [Cimex lectularius]
MGSLPNLRELERESETFRHVTRNFARQQAHCILRHHDIHHSSGHKFIRHTRSMGHYTGMALNTNNDLLNHFFTTEDMYGYSPVSSRSTRSSCTLHHHINNNLLVRRSSKHRDSMSSSGGASSVRRLIAVVRSTSSKTGPIYSRRLLFRNFAALCLGHAMITAAFVPLYTMQGSISVWWWQPNHSIITKYFHPNYDVGSLLLATFFSIGSISTLGTIFFINKLGTNWTLILSYGGTCIFFGFHLYPNIFTLVPAYMFMGLWLGPLVGGRITCLMTLATKLSYVMTEEEEGEIECSQGLRRTELVVHKLSRGLQIAQDFGLIIGNLAASSLIWYTKNSSNVSSDHDAMLDAMFPMENTGERICGSTVCPLSVNYDSQLVDFKYSDLNNTSNFYASMNINCKTSKMLISVFLGFCVMGVAVTAAFMDHIRVSVSKETSFRNACSTSYRLMQGAFKDPRLQLAAPLSIFIGLEQGFMYADFTKSYVACSLGVSNISLVFLSLGVLQSVAAFTLSLLLQHVRRHVIIGVGFIFQSCLLLVLFIWKPTKDDPALFYVVPAAWGVCNAIWDTLSF